ncbi:MAG: MBL fold metallo-hydrolase [Candidatus Aegiribacteria sp.]|nr:MBL fold metallo-hydrolase [Candidatus Aegiribacteria sp.]MBD3295547.1 MBL fold metallo-hydrolase [Candidatus Fermentibacteria bacterium]
MELIPSGPLEVNCYILGCPDTGEALVIDPGGDGPRISGMLRKRKLTPAGIVNTHGHFDHIGGNAYLMNQYSAISLYMHREGVPFLLNAGEHADYWGMPFQDSPEPTDILQGGEVLMIGNLEVEVVHTPGHSPGGISLLIPGHAFTGDTLFQGSVGRTDLPGGNHELLIKSIREKLLVLPDDTVIHPGHGPESTIGTEKRSNPFLR